MAEIVARKITDIKQVFLSAVSDNNLKLMNILIAAKPQELNPEYCESLILNSHDKNFNSALSQLKVQISEESLEDAQQAIGQDSYVNYEQ